MPGPEALNGPDIDYTPQYLNPQWGPVGLSRLKFPEEVRAAGSPPNPNSYFSIDPPVHPTGDDIVMTDVLSMDIKAAWFWNPNFNTPPSQINPLTGQPGIGNYGTSPPNAPAVQPGVVLPSVFVGSNMDEPFWDLPMSKLTPIQSNPNAHAYRPNGSTPASRSWCRTRRPIRPTGTRRGRSARRTQASGFLTSGTTAVPLRINVRALQIKLRVWDPRAEQARQATILSEV